MSRNHQYGRQCKVCRKGLKKNIPLFMVPLDEWDKSWYETCSREHQMRLINSLPEWEFLDVERLKKFDPEAYALYLKLQEQPNGD